MIGIVSNSLAVGLRDDFASSGEDLLMAQKLNFFLLNRGTIGRFLLMKVISLIGMGRTVEVLTKAYVSSTDEFECLMRDRFSFASKFSKKW